MDKEKEMTPQSRIQKRRMSQAEQKQERRKKSAEEEMKLKPRTRLIPIWLRIVIVVVLSFVCLIVGAAIGYGVIGEGDPTDALKIETWKHIYNLVMKQG